MNDLDAIKSGLSLINQRQWATLLALAPVYLGLLGICIAIEFSVPAYRQAATTLSPAWLRAIEIAATVGAGSLLVSLVLAVIGGAWWFATHVQSSKCITRLENVRWPRIEAKTPILLGKVKVKATDDVLKFETAAVPWKARWFMLKSALAVAAIFCIFAIVLAKSWGPSLVMLLFSGFALLAFAFLSRVECWRITSDAKGWQVERFHRVIWRRRVLVSLVLQLNEVTVAFDRLPNQAIRHARLVLSTSQAEIVGFSDGPLGVIEAHVASVILQTHTMPQDVPTPSVS